MPWKRDEKYLMSLIIWKQNHLKLQSKFRSKFSFNNYSQKSHIYRSVHISQTTGSINHLNKKPENPISGRKLTVRYPDNVDAVRGSVGRSPKNSLQKRFQEFGLSRTSLQRILKKDLPQYLYRMQIKRKLTPADIEFLVSVTKHYFKIPYINISISNDTLTLNKRKERQDKFIYS